MTMWLPPSPTNINLDPNEVSSNGFKKYILSSYATRTCWRCVSEKTGRMHQKICEEEYKKSTSNRSMHIDIIVYYYAAETVCVGFHMRIYGMNVVYCMYICCCYNSKGTNNTPHLYHIPSFQCANKFFCYFCCCHCNVSRCHHCFFTTLSARIQYDRAWFEMKKKKKIYKKYWKGLLCCCIMLRFHFLYNQMRHCDLHFRFFLSIYHGL